MKNVFTTEQKAIDAQEIDYQAMRTARGDLGSEYWSITTKWDRVRKRVDAEEWFYSVCPYGVQTHTQKEDTNSWYPEDN